MAKCSLWQSINSYCVTVVVFIFLCFRVSNQLSCNQKKIGTYTVAKMVNKSVRLWKYKVYGRQQQKLDWYPALAWTRIFIRMLVLVSLTRSPELCIARVQQHRIWSDIHQAILMIFKKKSAQLLKAHTDTKSQLPPPPHYSVTVNAHCSVENRYLWTIWHSSESDSCAKKQWQIWLKKHPEIHKITLWDLRLSQTFNCLGFFCNSPQILVFLGGFLFRCGPVCVVGPRLLSLYQPARWASRSPILQSLCSSQLCHGTWTSFWGKYGNLNHSSLAHATVVLSVLLGWWLPSAAAPKFSAKTQWPEW